MDNGRTLGVMRDSLCVRELLYAVFISSVAPDMGTWRYVDNLREMRVKQVESFTCRCER